MCKSFYAYMMGVSDGVEESPVFDHHIRPVEQVPCYVGEYLEVFDS